MKRIIFTVALIVLSFAGFPATHANAGPDGGILDPTAAAAYAYAACGELAQRILEPTAPPSSPTGCGIEPYHGHLATTHYFAVSGAAYTMISADATLTADRTAVQVALTAPGPGDGTAAAAALRALCDRAIYDALLAWTQVHGWYGPQAVTIATRAAAHSAADLAIDQIEVNLATALAALSWDAGAAAYQFDLMAKNQMLEQVTYAEGTIGHAGHATQLGMKLYACVPLDSLYLSFVDLFKAALGSGPAPI